MTGSPTAGGRQVSSARGAAGAVGAVGAVGGQVVLAAGSFLLQLLAARSLGADGLGVFALLLGSMVVATAISSGLVGDSLTVLDRHDAGIRSALTWMALGTITLAGGAALAAGAAGGLDLLTAALFAAATVAFMAADLLRRVLMACQRFWRLVVVDSVALAASLLTVGASASAGDLVVAHFLAALCVGQTVACVVAWVCLPADERAMPRRTWGSPRAVAAFGCWRAAQQFVRPTTLNLTRLVVLAVAGQAAVGQLEAARLVVAPAMLLVQGVGAYLFASYAAAPDEPLDPLLRRADRGAAVLLGCSLGIAGLAAAALPVVEDVVTGGGFDVATTAVLGWGLYAASCAVVLPYGSLAAVRGRQVQVFGLRVVDSLAGLGATAIALWWVGAPPSSVPWLLSLGSVVAGGLVRQRLLVPHRTASAQGPQRQGVLT